MAGPSIPAVVRERASLAPDDLAVTYVDYDEDWNGVETSLTWSELLRRSLNVARAIKPLGQSEDRAVILASQNLDYIAAFLGAMQAGFVAVPLSAPMGGASDERVTSVLDDATPTVVLTTKAAVDDVNNAVKQRALEITPTVVALDSLDLDAPGEPGGGLDAFADAAYLQYTSGSTRAPAGVVISHRNVMANYEQLVADFFRNTAECPRRVSPSCRGCPSTTTWVWSWASVSRCWPGCIPSSRAQSPFWLDRRGGCTCWPAIPMRSARPQFRVRGGGAEGLR